MTGFEIFLCVTWVAFCAAAIVYMHHIVRNVSTTLRQQLLDFKLDFLRLSLVG